MTRVSVRAAAVAGLLAATAPLPSAAAADADNALPAHAPSTSPLPASRGLQLGARLGYALPLGAVDDSGTSLSNLQTAAVPIGVDAGYRLTPRLYLGGTVAWGPGTAPKASSPCTSAGVSCSRQDAQVRGEVRFYFAPEAKVGGWLALGAGWELASFAQTSGGDTITATRTGPILPDMQLGVDFRRGATAIGAYFGVSFAMFVTQGLDPSASPVSTWILDRGAHAWTTLGLRGSYGPW